MAPEGTRTPTTRYNADRPAGIPFRPGSCLPRLSPRFRGETGVVVLFAGSPDVRTNHPAGVYFR